MYRGARLAFALCLLATAPLAPLRAAESPRPIERGTPVSVALETLRQAGLDLIYSDRLVPPALRVDADPGGGAPAEVAARILAPHGLALQPVPGGRYAVVRAGAAPGGGAMGAAPAGPPGAAEAAAATRDTVEVVTVYASRYRVDAIGASVATELSRVDLQALPGLDEDVMRVARYLPGNATNGLSARTNVRGGRDDEVIALFDGVPLFAPFHFKDYQAVLGVIDPAAIDSLEFYSGVFPVRYGDRMSAVMDIAPRDARDGSHHELGVSLLAAHALSAGETDLRGRPLRWLASGRTSTTQVVAKAAERDGIDPEFTDLLLRGERVYGDWTVTLGGLALRDELRYLEEDDGRGDRSEAAYRDAGGWIALRHAPRDRVAFEATLAGAHRRTDRRGSLDRPGSVVGLVDDRRDVASRYLRAEARSPPGTWTVGVEALDLEATYDYLGGADFDPLLAALFGRPASFRRASRVDADGRAFALYGSRLFEPAPRWRVDAGLRIDDWSYDARVAAVAAGGPGAAAAPARSRLDSTDISPRIAVEYAWDGQTTLRAGLGRATQSERSDELQVPDGEPSYHAVQAADQLVVGIERRFGARNLLRAEAYRKDIPDPAPRYENLLDPVTLLPELEVDRARVAPGAATLYGIELTGRVSLARQWSGWLAYAWSEATDEIDGRSVPRSWNQQHSIATGAAWSHRPWELSANMSWHSGWRRTVIRAPALPGAPPVVDRNAGEWSDFFSLDLRATWTRPLQVGQLRLYADVSNATGRANPCCTELAVVRQAGIPISISSRERNWLPRYAIVGATWELP
jgi:outer membrane receptor protein involved in Fe transport